MNPDTRDIVALDKTIHEPARLAIMAGNLSTHVAKLEEAGYVTVAKSFNGKIPHTAYALTRQGRAAFARYHKELSEITKRVGKPRR